jgi:hypothetical protein
VFELLIEDSLAFIKLNEFANCTIRFSISAILILFNVFCTLSKAFLKLFADVTG